MGRVQAHFLGARVRGLRRMLDRVARRLHAAQRWRLELHTHLRDLLAELLARDAQKLDAELVGRVRTQRHNLLVDLGDVALQRREQQLGRRQHHAREDERVRLEAINPLGARRRGPRRGARQRKRRAVRALNEAQRELRCARRCLAVFRVLGGEVGRRERLRRAPCVDPVHRLEVARVHLVPADGAPLAVPVAQHATRPCAVLGDDEVVQNACVAEHMPTPRHARRARRRETDGAAGVAVCVGQVARRTHEHLLDVGPGERRIGVGDLGGAVVRRLHHEAVLCIDIACVSHTATYARG